MLTECLGLHGAGGHGDGSQGPGAAQAGGRVRVPSDLAGEPAAGGVLGLRGDAALGLQPGQPHGALPRRELAGHQQVGLQRAPGPDPGWPV